MCFSIGTNGSSDHPRSHGKIIAFEVREGNPNLCWVLICVGIIGLPVQLIREVFLRFIFVRRRRHTFASL